MSSGSDGWSETLKPGVRRGVTGTGWPGRGWVRGCLSWDLNDEKQPLSKLHRQVLQPLGTDLGSWCGEHREKISRALRPAHMLMLPTASSQRPVSLLLARASLAPCRSHQLRVRTLPSPHCSRIRHQLGPASVFLPSLGSSVNFSWGPSTGLIPFYSQILY